MYYTRTNKTLLNVPIDTITENICLKYINHDAINFYFIPTNFQTIDFYRKAIIENPIVFSYLPIQNETLIYTAVDMSPDLFRFVKEEFITPELLLDFISVNGLNIRYVDKKYINNELSKIAMEYSPEVLQFIDEEFQTLEICKKAVTKFPHVIQYIKNMEIAKKCIGALNVHILPLEYVNFSIDEDYLITNLEENPLLLRFIQNQTQIMCNNCCKSNYMALEYVKNEFKTYEMCLNAVISDGFSIVHVPHEYYTEKLCLEAVKTYNHALSIIGIKQTEKICFAAIDAFYSSFMYVINQTYSMCMYAIERNELNIEYVEHKFRTPELCIPVIKKFPTLFRHIKKNEQTPEMCMIAVQRYPSNLIYVNPLHMSSQMFYGTIHASLLKYIPKMFKTYELCFNSVSQLGGTYLHHVPNKFRDEKMCLASAKNLDFFIKYKYMKYVPRKLKRDPKFLTKLENINKELISSLPKKLRNILNMEKMYTFILGTKDPKSRVNMLCTDIFYLIFTHLIEI